MAKTKKAGAARATSAGKKPPHPDTTGQGPTPLAAGEVALHEGLTIIETSDASDLTTLLADPRLASLVVARIGSTAAAVLPQAAPRLLLALIKAGHTPTVIGGP